MADIVLNGESLELSANYRITQVQVSGHFSTDIRQDLTQPFTLPYTDSPRNQRILRNIDIPQAILQSEKFSVFYEFGGTYYPAELVLRELKDKLQVNIYFDKQALTVLSLNCDEISWPNNIPVAILYSNARHQIWPDNYVFFPIIGAPNFYDDEDTDPSDKQNPDWLGIINRHNLNTGGYSVNGQHFNGDGKNVTSLAPQIALLEVLKRGFEINDYKIEGDFILNKAARRAFVFNNVVLDRGLFTKYDNCLATRSALSQSVFDATSDFHFPFNSTSTTAFNLTTFEYECGQLGELKIHFKAEANYVQNSFWHIRFRNPQGNVSSLTFRQYFNHYGPMELEATKTITQALKFSKIYIQVLSPSGYNTTFDVKDAEVAFTMDRVPEAVFDRLGDCGRFLPDMKFIDLVKEMMQGFNLRMDLDRLNKVVSFNYRQQALQKQSSQNLSPFIHKLETEFVKRDNYLVKYDMFSSIEQELQNPLHTNCLLVSDTGQSSFLLDAPTSHKGEEVTLKTYPMITDKVDNGGTILNSSIYYGKAFSTIYETGANKMTKLRIGFFTGNASTLPTADNNYIEGNEGLDLRISADPLSVGTHWSNWLVWLVRDNRNYTAICYVPKTFLSRLNIQEPFHINEVKYLVDEVESIIEKQDTVRAEFRMKLI